MTFHSVVVKDMLFFSSYSYYVAFIFVKTVVNDIIIVR